MEQDSTEWLNTSDPPGFCDIDRDQTVDYATTSNTDRDQAVTYATASNTDSLPGLCDNDRDQSVEMDDVEVDEALSAVNLDSDAGILQEDALQYIAEYIIRKQHLLEYEDHSNSTFTWVDQISKGFLKKPSPSFLRSVQCLETVFHSLNLSEIVHCKNIKQRLVDHSTHVDLPENVKRFF